MSGAELSDPRKLSYMHSCQWELLFCASSATPPTIQNMHSEAWPVSPMN